ncbi:MAG: hypothetical protein ACOY99_03125 [Pseudomonadota bacterium]
MDEADFKAARTRLDEALSHLESMVTRHLESAARTDGDAKRIAALEARLAALSAERDALKDELAAAKKRQAELARAYGELQAAAPAADMAAKLPDVDSLRQAYDDLERAYADLQDELAASRGATPAGLDELARLKARLAEEREKAGKLEVLRKTALARVDGALHRLTKIAG